ncbi:MAG: IscS subfamily cysteine desulfurase [Spirosomataceae bacterium]|mgnify:CR=1 FL=1
MKLPIYLDYNATTPVDTQVLEAMLPWFSEQFGNAASRTHLYGWEAQEAVEIARRQVADLLGASEKEIVFTSGATESNNLAIKGVFEAQAYRGKHLITVATEHKAVLDTCKHVEQLGGEVTYLQPQADGLIRPEQVAEALRSDTLLVSVMMAHNEIGVIQPLAEIAALCHAKGVLFHTDATQAVGKLPIDVQVQNIDLLSLSAHKLYGPKGIGALYVRKNVKLTAQLDGGGHERGRRSGTLNVPGIVGLGKACEAAERLRTTEQVRLGALRDYLEQSLLAALPACFVNGNTASRLAHVTNMAFADVDGEQLLMNLKDIAVSSGSACTSASVEPSYVLKSLGVPDDLAYASVRFSLGRYTTEEQIQYAIKHVVEVVQAMRQ